MIKLIVSLFVTLSACNYNHVKQAAPGGDERGTAGASDNPDYQSVKAGVIGQRCVGCHSQAGGNQGGVNLETYERVHALLSRITFRALEKRDMPPGRPLSSDEARTLDTWINNGARETNPVGTEKPDPSLSQGPNDWHKVRDKIFNKKCNDCHSGANAAAALDLTDLAQVRAKVLVIFDRVIIKGDMPVLPYPAMTPKERFVLLQWFNAGLPE